MNQIINNENEELIDLMQIFQFIWKTKAFTIIGTLLASAASILIALNIQNIYISDSLLAPADEGVGGIEKMVSQYGALAGMAGIDVGGADESVNATDEAIALLKSRDFIGNFIENRNILIPVMASKLLNNNGVVIYDDNIYNETTQKWTRTPPSNRNKIPSFQEAAELFIKEQLIVSKDISAGFISISIRNISSQNAQRWLEWLIADLNKHFSDYDRGAAERSINFLNKQAESTNISTVREMFYRLVEDQTRKLMSIESRDDYKFKIIIPPHKPEVKSYPKRSVMCIMGAFFGAFLSLLISFILYLNNLKISFTIKSIKFISLTNFNEN